MKESISISRFHFKSVRALLVLSTSIGLTICSCSDGKLTESKAATVLQTLYPKTKTSTVQISDLSLSPSIPQSLKYLRSKGLATYQYIPPGQQGYGCYGQLTADGKKYIDRVISNEFISMVTAKIEFDKVTGVLEVPQTNSAEVDYTDKVVEITPVGQMYSDVQMGQTSAHKAYFVKYNDGWRLQQQQ